jgi:hypothetical protein
MATDDWGGWGGGIKFIGLDDMISGLGARAKPPPLAVRESLDACRDDGIAATRILASRAEKLAPREKWRGARTA